MSKSTKSAWVSEYQTHGYKYHALCKQGTNSNALHRPMHTPCAHLACQTLRELYVCRRQLDTSSNASNILAMASNLAELYLVVSA